MIPLERAIFAGGCFWCMEYAFSELDVEVRVGYTGGDGENPSYEEVCSGETGHFEAIEVAFDPEKFSYERLLETFWRNIDAFDAEGQFIDRGNQYRTAIFYLNERQRELAEESKRRIEKAGIFEEVKTLILPAKEFWEAEDYHQAYYKKCPSKFKSYHQSSGREDFTRDAWKEYEAFRLFPERQSYWIGYRKPSKDSLRKLLTSLQFRVTQENGTETPFQNEYWNNHEEGIYVDVVSGEPLFSSLDKFDSGTGWPSFINPLEDSIVEKLDTSHGMQRIEVRSRHADSHLGHVFRDKTPTGLRYCINSAALRFIPKDKLSKFGYVAYEPLLRG